MSASGLLEQVEQKKAFTVLIVPLLTELSTSSTLRWESHIDIKLVYTYSSLFDVHNTNYFPQPDHLLINGPSILQNQFFLSGLSGDEFIQNRVSEALYRRIIRAHKEQRCFRVIIVLPLIPGFQVQILGF